MVILSEELVLQKTRSENLANVRNLNLWGSDLSDVSILQRMPNVEVLSLSVNKIRSLKEFRNCNCLTELYLRKNNITDLMEVTHLQSLQNLQILWLCDNPCVGASASDYRQRTIAMLPNIMKLDNIDVTAKERAEALDRYAHLSPTHTPNYTGSDESWIAEHAASLSGATSISGHALSKPASLTIASHLLPASPHIGERNLLHAHLTSPSSTLRESQLKSPLALRESRVWTGNGSAGGAAGMPKSCARAPSNVLYAVLALVKELDGDQLLAVQSEVALRLQVLESSYQ